MKIAVIVSDATHVVHIGGELDRRVMVFNMPDDMAAYVKNWIDRTYTTVSFSIVEEQP